MFMMVDDDDNHFQLYGGKLAASDDNDGASSHSYMHCWKGHPHSVDYQLFVDTMTIGGHVVIVDLGSLKELLFHLLCE